MWNIRRLTSNVDADLASSVQDLLESTSRAMILGISGVFIGAIFATAIWPEQIGINIWIAVPAIIVIGAISYRLLSTSYLGAHALWQLGLVGTITWLVHLFQRPEIAFFYAFLPLISVITLQRFSGFVMEGLIALAVYWMYHGLLHQAPAPMLGLTILLGGLISALLGWVSFNSLVTVMQWSIFSTRQAHQNLAETRDHRAQLAKVVKELDHANMQLERAINMLVLARNEAEEAKDARNRFALAISHELRSPLNFIIGFSELMVNKPTTYAPREKWPTGLYEDIQQVYTSSQHLMRLVNDVLDLGQIESLQMALMKEWVDPGVILQEVEKMVQPAVNRKKLSFELKIEDGLPILYIDHTRIRQVLLNLVSNSLRFTDRGKIMVSAAMQADNTVLFCVEDTGSGIEPDDMSKIFEPFHHVSQESWRRREGAGLGVPISRRFVELHGGQMWVESQVGQGTHFYFTLPASGSRDNAVLFKNLDEVDRQYWERLKKEAESRSTLLILSKDPAAAEVIAPYVEKFEVIPVNDSSQVSAQVRELLPRAILVDRAIAIEPDNWSRLVHLPYDLPVISFTFPGNPSKPKNLPETITDYLVKPVYYDTLLKAIEKIQGEVTDILVVDDDPAMVRFVERSLMEHPNPATGEQKYHVFSAKTGQEAIDQLKAHLPDVILLDLALPDFSGWEVVEKIKDYHVPTILVTAHDWPQALSQDGQDVLRVYMHRPLSREELSSALKLLLNQLHPRYPANLDELMPEANPAG